ncbi:MAG: hypothetical protein CMB99_07020 [Flavobacteriaceae bacterium]|nr:hypothetical protein [Flavobacteriaceae bacterium]
MGFKKHIFTILFLLSSLMLCAQVQDSVKTKNRRAKKRALKNTYTYNPLAPSKAAFYSAIFPGMGQIYNKKYWKAPIVWGALAIPTYFYLDNNREYKRFRTAFKLRTAGLQDEFTLDDGSVTVSLETLERAQEQLRQNRDLSILSGVILYILQIVEASVNAHLIQFNTSDALTLRPVIIQDQFRIDAPSVGLNLRFNF